MSGAAVAQYILETFEGVRIGEGWGYQFFYYNPDDRRPNEIYFATLQSGDQITLNIGGSKATYRSLFGPSPALSGDAGAHPTGDDFTVRDQVLPHPDYKGWVSIPNPSEETLRNVIAPLLSEAYDLAVNRYAKRLERE